MLMIFTCSRIMEKLITDSVEKTSTFLIDLVKLESRHTTINTYNFVDQQLELKQAFKSAREKW